MYSFLHVFLETNGTECRCLLVIDYADKSKINFPWTDLQNAFWRMPSSQIGTVDRAETWKSTLLVLLNETYRDTSRKDCLNGQMMSWKTFPQPLKWTILGLFFALVLARTLFILVTSFPIISVFISKTGFHIFRIFFPTYLESVPPHIWLQVCSTARARFRRRWFRWL